MPLDINVSPEGREALQCIFGRAERGNWKKTTLPFFGRNGSKVYSKMRDASAINNMHAYLQNAKDQGAISIEWERHHEGTQIERIRVKDLQTLAEYLGVKTLTSRIEAAQSIMSPVLANAPSWVGAVVDTVYADWEAGKKPLRLSPDDGLALAHVIRLITHLEQEGAKFLDMRSLSVRLFNDSKLIEGIIGPLIGVYRLAQGASAQSDQEFLADLGLEKYPLPVLVKGPVEILLADGDTICPRSCPYLGIPPDHIDRSSPLPEAKYLLTIENLSSFNTFARGQTDSGIILFTHGFPSRHLQALYRDLINRLPIGFPVYHWGDIDVGGFRILAKLQQLAAQASGNYSVRPYMMDPSALDAGTPDKGLLSPQEQKALSQVKPVNPEVDALIEHILSEAPQKVEQEAIFCTAWIP